MFSVLKIISMLRLWIIIMVSVVICISVGIFRWVWDEDVFLKNFNVLFFMKIMLWYVWYYVVRLVNFSVFSYVLYVGCCVFVVFLCELLDIRW